MARQGKLICSPWMGWLIGHRLGFGISPAMPCGPAWQWGRIALHAIVPLLCSFPHTNTAPEQSKGHHGAYKPIISYQVRAWGRGGQGGSQHESVLSAPEGQGRGGASGDIGPPPRTDTQLAQRTPHPTRLGPTLRIARAGDPEKYPISNTVGKK